MELEKESGTLTFGAAEAYSIKGRRNVPSFVYSLCYQSTDHVDIATSYTFLGVRTVMEFLRPCFPM